MRLFAAAMMEIPPGLAARLELSARETLGPAARTVAPDSMHLTLAFIGEAGRDRVTDALRCLESLAGTGPFTAEPGGAGFFPSAGAPEVFWLGFAGGAERLAAAAAKLSAELRGAGFSLKERPFAAHLTLARLKGRVSRESADKAAAAAADICRGVRLGVKGAALFSSELTPAGPKYSELGRTVF
jgi:2'-5' RNA ligase